MIASATKRSILRGVHLVLSVPVVGYIYSRPAEAQQYAFATRFVFLPLMVLAGYWMYAGVVFALLGVALWLGASYLSGSGAIILSQVALFIARRIWLMIRTRRMRQPAAPLT